MDIRESATISSSVSRAGRVLGIINSAERAIAFLAFMVLVLVVFLDVASREVTGTGLHWALQIGVYANLFVVMAGLGVAAANGAHLRPQFADGWLPRAWEPWLVRLQEAVTTLFFIGFALVGAIVVAETRELGERAPVLGNLIWPLQGLIPAAFLLAAIRHGFYAAWPDLRPPSAATAARGGE